MSQLTLGIDVSKDTLDVILLAGEKAQYRQAANTAAGFEQLGRWLQIKTNGLPVHACLEATGQYGDGIALFLYEQGHQVSVVNPARIKAYAASTLRRFKNDKGDAELIASYCQRERPDLWTPPSESFTELQAMMRHLDDLKKMYQQENNRLKSGVKSARVLASLRQHLEFLAAQIKQLSDDIDWHSDQDPELKTQKGLLQSIIGIGDLTALKLLSEVRDFRAFANAPQLAAYVGLVPEERVSGSSVRGKSRLSRKGNAHLRKALYMPALSALRYNPLIIALKERMLKTGHSRMAIVGAAMRKLLHLAYGVIKTGKPFDPNHAQTAMA
jgi:transposase